MVPSAIFNSNPHPNFEPGPAFPLVCADIFIYFFITIFKHVGRTICIHCNPLFSFTIIKVVVFNLFLLVVFWVGLLIIFGGNEVFLHPGICILQWIHKPMNYFCKCFLLTVVSMIEPLESTPLRLVKDTFKRRIRVPF